MASCPLIGFLSCGQADITAMQSASARMSNLSPADDTVGSKDVEPSDVIGIFIQRLNGSGTSGADRPITAIAIRRLSAQLS